MDFEKLFPGCEVRGSDVVLAQDGFVRLIAHRENDAWELSDYAKSLGTAQATTAENAVESPKKRGKKAASVDLDDLDI